MKVFQLDPAKLPRVIRNLILTYVFLALVALLVIYLYIRDALFNQGWGLIILVVVSFSAVGYYAIRQQKRYWDEFKLTLRAETLTRTAPKMGELQVKKTNVTRVRMVRNGMIVSTKSNPNALLIPRALKNAEFEFITKTLEKWASHTD